MTNTITYYTHGKIGIGSLGGTPDQVVRQLADMLREHPEQHEIWEPMQHALATADHAAGFRAAFAQQIAWAVAEMDRPRPNLSHIETLLDWAAMGAERGYGSADAITPLRRRYLTIRHQHRLWLLRVRRRDIEDGGSRVVHVQWAVDWIATAEPSEAAELRRALGALLRHWFEAPVWRQGCPSYPDPAATGRQKVRIRELAETAGVGLPQ